MIIKILQWFNLAGVVLLAGLCAIQWETNRRLNLERIDLEARGIVQARALADKDKTIAGNLADMNDFRERLMRSDDALKAAQAALADAQAKDAALQDQLAQAKSSNDALKTSLEQWKSAVAARDDALQQAGAQARTLAADRNDAIAQFNDLAGRYNAAEAQLKEAADELKKLADDRNDVVAKFNDLANKYNALAQPLGGAATRP